MTRNVLILTPSLGFGELIRQFFEDTGGFVPVLQADAARALEDASQGAIDLTVLDAEFQDLDLSKLAQSLRQSNPEMRLLVIPAEDRPLDPQLDALQADSLLPSPFYLPDLMSALEDLYGSFVPRDVRTLRGADAGRLPRKPAARARQTAPEWLGNVSQAAQYLTRLSLESAAQAALITRNHEVWAYAGELPQPAAEELAAELASHWEDASTDLARFVHLQATRGDYMLYATSLGGDYILAMVFDAEMPFSQMRTQASQMAEALAVAPKREIAADSADNTAAARLEAEHPPSTGGEPQRADDESESEPEPELSHEHAQGLPQPEPALASQADVTARVAGLGAAAAGSSELQYTYVMIPRLPSHRLEGDLARKLADWLPQLCLAFGWRLEQFNVQPDFLQWTISMAPDAPPESAANTLEKYLSERIFDQFPRVQRDNPSGKFWAPGFLIVSGGVPGEDLVSEYIQQTRRRQGAPHNG